MGQNYLQLVAELYSDLKRHQQQTAECERRLAEVVCVALDHESAKDVSEILGLARSSVYRLAQTARTGSRTDGRAGRYMTGRPPRRADVSPQP